MPPATDHPTEAAILEALRGVRDPVFDRDIVDLGYVQDLQLKKGKIAFTIAHTVPGKAQQEALGKAAETAAAAVPGVSRVRIANELKVRGSKPLLGGKGIIPAVKNVVAVSSGKGGVGKSTVAVNLACALHAEGARVGILDADAYGPNVPLMLGLKGEPKEDNGRLVPFTVHGIQAMSMGMLVPEDKPVIWRGPMLHKVMDDFLFRVSWRDLDYLVVDMPPGTGDAQLSLSQKVHVSGAVIVTTPQEVSVLDVRKAIRMFQTVHVPVLGVVENMAWFTPPGTTERLALFGSGGGKRVEEEFGIPLLGQLPLDPAVREGGDDGRPIVLAEPRREVSEAFADTARRVAEIVAIANA